MYLSMRGSPSSRWSRSRDKTYSFAFINTNEYPKKNSRLRWPIPSSSADAYVGKQIFIVQASDGSHSPESAPQTEMKRWTQRVEMVHCSMVNAYILPFEFGVDLPWPTLGGILYLSHEEAERMREYLSRRFRLKCMIVEKKALSLCQRQINAYISQSFLLTLLEPFGAHQKPGTRCLWPVCGNVRTPELLPGS